MLTCRLVRNIPLQEITVSSRLNFEYPARRSLENDEEDRGGGSGSVLLLPLLRKAGCGWELLMGAARVDPRPPLEGAVLPQALVVEEKDSCAVLEALIRTKSETRSFNWVERALALERMVLLDMEHRADLLQLLDIPPATDRGCLFLRLARSHDGVRCPVAEGRLHPSTVFEIFGFEETEHQGLARFISGLALGTRKRNHLLAMVHDICTRDQVTASAVLLENRQALEIMESPMDPSHRGARLFSWIEQQRYPVMAGYRRRFLRLMEETGVTRCSKVALPRDFERWEFTLSVDFSTAEELRRKLGELENIAGGEPFRRLMDRRREFGRSGQ